jgi:Flp pilus assembly protein TadG
MFRRRRFYPQPDDGELMPAATRAAISKFIADARASSAVEFAFLSPVFLLILTASADFGLSMYDRFNLNAAVSAAANYALVNAANVESADGPTLASNLGLIVANGHAANWANATIVVNNGPTATLTAGVLTTGGTASNANSCYCPTVGSNGVAWGSVATCGAACASGGVAGKFVYISATTQYTSIFGSNAVIATGPLAAKAMVETE